MIIRLATLLGLTLTAWGILAGLAWVVLGGDVFLVSAVAMGLCLVPALGTLAWGLWSQKQTTLLNPGRAAVHEVAALLGGTMGRMMVVGLGVFALVQTTEYYREHSGFLVWVFVFYLITLGLEVVLLLFRSGQGSRSGPSSGDGAVGTSQLRGE